MRAVKTMVIKTKRGNVLKIYREHHLRDDIWCGSTLCCECGPYQGPQPPRLSASLFYVIIDTNIALHQIDLIEHSTFGKAVDLIFLETVLNEARHQSKRVHTRLQNVIKDTSRNCYLFDNEHHRSTFIRTDCGESPNDFNDRKIRVACGWYSRHLSTQKSDVRLVLLTNDAQNLLKAKNDGLACFTPEIFVKEHLKEYPELLEVIARPAKGTTDVKYFEYHSHEVIERGIKEGKFIRGKLNMKFYGGFKKLGFVFGKDSEILIEGNNINRAIDGDIVAVELISQVSSGGEMDTSPDAVDSLLAIDESISTDTLTTRDTLTQQEQEEKVQTKQYGKIVGIMQKNWRPYCGSLEETEQLTGYVLFVPVDQKIPKIRIQSRLVQELMDKRIVVNIDTWDVGSMYPEGHYVKTLGKIGDRDTETAVILMEYDVPTEEWADNTLACLPPDDSLSECEIKKRVDLREIPVFSVDPPGCTDIDDALHVKKLPNGLFEVGVHIADVAHYVKCDTALDEVGATRGTSVYLVERRIDMLPQLLSTNVCSLVSKKDRYAFSVVWEMNDEAEIQDTRFHRSVIRSVASLEYNEAQQRIDGQIKDELTDNLVKLNDLAKCLKAKRMEAGALTLASPAVKFTLDEETEEPTEVGLYQTKEANSMIEEFMLLANITVAKKILEHYPTFALLRRHPPPSPSGLQRLIKVTKARGFEMDVSSSKAFGHSLDQCEIEGFPYFNTIIRTIATRSMMQAVYFCSGDVNTLDYRHYGLASDIYTHFTSPIRRYADIIVHRLLASAIGISPLPDSLKNREKMRKICECINHRHRMAQQAGRSSVGLHTLIYFKERKCEGEDAVICEVRPNGISVAIPRFGITHMIKLVSRADMEANKNPFSYDDDLLTLTRATDPPIRFQIFDRIKVNIFVATSRAHRSRLVVEIDDPRMAPPSRTRTESVSSRSVR